MQLASKHDYGVQGMLCCTSLFHGSDLLYMSGRAHTMSPGDVHAGEPKCGIMLHSNMHALCKSSLKQKISLQSRCKSRSAVHVLQKLF